MKLLEGKTWAARLFLLVVSNFFYGYWDPRFLVLLWLSIIVDFSAGLLLGRAENITTRKIIVAASVIFNLGLLGFFKYFDFFQTSVHRIFEILGLRFSNPGLLNVILPVGISFYTFQSMSYVLDIYRHKIQPCRNLILYALYVCYFPQLVAGPIGRAGHLLPQLTKPFSIRLPNILSGLLLIVWGLFKKAVVADNVGLYIVDPIFERPYDGLQLWLGSIGFGIQVYCDFSGYCDIARGVSRCLGIEIVDNFLAPYFSSNITDFWRRWHITLTGWFRDYLYIPLGGNRCGKMRTCFNLWVTMQLCGLWHGAAWRYVLWGFYHGTLLLVHRLMGGGEKNTEMSATPKQKLSCFLKSLGCFLLVSFGWMIFRADGLRIRGFAYQMLNPLSWSWSQGGMKELISTLAVCLGIVAMAHGIQIKAQQNNEEIEGVFRYSPVLIGCTAGLMLAVTFLLGSLGENTPFIYFQF